METAGRAGHRPQELSVLVRLQIEGRQVAACAGATVMEAAQQAGIYIPSLCSHTALPSHGTCRICMVAIEGVPGYPIACTTPVEEKMVVWVNPPEVLQLRRSILEHVVVSTQHPRTCLECHRRERCSPTMTCQRFLAVRNMEKCLFCPQNQRCELQRAATHIGVKPVPAIPYEYPGLPVLPGGPFFDRDYNLCIVCGRCVRACEEIRGRTAIAFTYRREQPAVDSRFGLPLEQTDCEFCGACVDVCPTGALMESHNKPGLAQQAVTTICPYCGVGCQLRLEVRDSRVLRAVPDMAGAANRGQACVKGRFGITEVVHHPDRLLTPLIREDGSFRPATWEEALGLVAARFKGYRGEEVAVLGTGKATNEDNYVLQKFARTVLQTRHIDHCARLCHAPSVSGLAQSFGSGAMTNSIADIAAARCILAIGTNTRASHPVIGLEVVRAARHGAKLIVANPRWTELNHYADLWLRHLPGTDVALLMGMMRVIVEEGLLDEAFIQQRCEGYPELRASLAEFPLEAVERLTRVDANLVRQAARTYATEKPAAILYAMGITQSSHGTDNVLAISNLALLTGNIGQPGSGVNPLRGHNNVQGACDMGVLPDLLPGYQRVDNPQARAKFEQAWGHSIPAEVGLSMEEIFDAAYERRIKAMLIMGGNAILSEPCSRHTQGALEGLEFLVVQDMFLSETAQRATVVLPACSFAEKDGTFTNTERRVQRVRAALSPLGESQPDWWIVCQLARGMRGQGFDYQHPTQIMEEIAGLVPQYGGISYPRLESGGIQWPCPSPDHPGTPILHTQGFPRGRGKLFPLTYKPPAELPDGEFPLILTTERSLFQFHTGTMTRRVPGLNQLRGEELVEMNPRDAQALGIASGDLVRVLSRRGEVEAKAVVTDASPPGVVSMTFHFAESPTNLITNPAVDPVAKIPEFKVAAVRVEKVSG